MIKFLMAFMLAITYGVVLDAKKGSSGRVKSTRSSFTASYSTKTAAPKARAYTKKAPIAGMGKPSKVNGLPKTKVVNGHMKKTKNSYTYVNPYSRSK